MTHTEIVVILDRSGSMETIRRDMEGGFAAFVREQKQVGTDCTLSLYRFDDRFETAYEGRALGQVRGLRLVPRGSTALFDAVARAIGRVRERHRAMPRRARPQAVIVMIITDGHENASREVQNAETIRRLVREREATGGWRFMYLGADVTSLTDASALGIQTAARYDADADGVADLYREVSAAVSSYRRARATGDVAAEIALPRRIRRPSPS